MTEFVVTALMKRRAELLKEVQAADATLRRLLDDVEHVDGAIRTFDPAYRARKVKAVPLPHTSRGTLVILRNAKEPMSVRDIALRILADQGRDATDAKLVASTAGHTRSALSRYRRIGAVRPVEGSVSGRGGGLGAGMLWEVVR
jgi:hypothetical protein